MIWRNLLLLCSCLLVANAAIGDESGVQLRPGAYSDGMITIGNDGEYLSGDVDDVVGEDGRFVCHFTFGGRIAGTTFRVQCRNAMDAEPIGGTVTVLSDTTFHLKTDENPGCSNMIASFEDDGVVSALSVERPILQVRTVRSAQAHLYSDTLVASRKSTYLVESNVVTVLEKAGDWLRVEWASPPEWMRESDLHPLVTDASPADARAAREHNSRGFGLYKSRDYGQALECFRQSFEADPAYHLAHYNFACTAALLLAQDRCAHIELLDEIFQHLDLTAALKPEYRLKMRQDADLEAVRGYVRFHLASGHSPEDEEGLRHILTSVRWYGPREEMFPASPVLELDSDGTCRVGHFTIAGEADPDYMWTSGHFGLHSRRLTLEMEQDAGDGGGPAISGEYERGQLIFDDGQLPTLTDSDQPCSFQTESAEGTP